MGVKFKNRTCPLCGGRDLRQPFQAPGPFVECENCGLLLQAAGPVPNLNSVYEDDEEDSSAQRILAEERARDSYYNHLFDWIVRNQPAPSRVLEIACGSGGLLKRFLDAGCNCEGIEPSSRLRQFATERLGETVPIHPSRLEEVAVDPPGKRFDTLIGIDVIEHLPDPLLLPRLAFDWLVPGGALFLQTPNGGSIRRYIQKENWEQLAPEEHLFIHTENSLRRLLEGVGFERVSITPTSGSSVDSGFRRAAMQPIGAVLRWAGLGNGLRAVARKGKE